MNEHIRTAAFRLDEAKTLLRVKPLHGTDGQDPSPLREGSEKAPEIVNLEVANALDRGDRSGASAWKIAAQSLAMVPTLQLDCPSQAIFRADPMPFRGRQPAAVSEPLCPPLSALLGQPPNRRLDDLASGAKPLRPC